MYNQRFTEIARAAVYRRPGSSSVRLTVKTGQKQSNLSERFKHTYHMLIVSEHRICSKDMTLI